MNNRKANFKTYNRMRWILLSSAAFYAGFAYVCIKYSILINWETYSTGGKIFALTAGLCLLYFLIWLIAIGTESIEVKVFLQAYITFLIGSGDVQKKRMPCFISRSSIRFSLFP